MNSEPVAFLWFQLKFKQCASSWEKSKLGGFVIHTLNLVFLVMGTSQKAPLSVGSPNLSRPSPLNPEP